MNFAEKLRQLRNQKGISQEAAAKAIGAAAPIFPTSAMSAIPRPVNAMPNWQNCLA